MSKEKKANFHLPHVLTLIFLLIVMIAALTWILPSGQFDYELMDTAAGEREVAIAGTYHVVEKVTEDGIDLRQSLPQILMAPGRGIQNGIEVIAFVFIIGGVFQIMAKTDAMTLGIQRIVRKLGTKEILIIPILMVLFGLGGSTFGMSDELVPFYILIMPIMFAMGYDSMTTFLTVYLSAIVGYAASTINPFSVLIAQGVVGIQGNPQLIFRMVQWIIMMIIIIGFTTWRALQVKKNPEKSITYQDDIVKKKRMIQDVDFMQDMTIRQKFVIITFVAGMILVVIGLVKWGWYMNELSMCFFGMGLLMGIVGGMSETEIAEEFLAGVKDIAFAAMVIGFCSGIMVVAQEGMIIDTILNALSNLVKNAGNGLFAVILYIVHSLLTLLVPSSSGLAALSMPIMAPLCDLHGANPEAAVTALQYGNQLTNLVSPIAGTTVAGLAVCKISFEQWWKTIWKIWLLLVAAAILFVALSASM